MYPPGKSVPAVVIFVIRVESVQRWMLSAFSYWGPHIALLFPGFPEAAAAGAFLIHRWRNIAPVMRACS